MKKTIPWVVGALLILFGILNLANSIIGGLLSLIAGLLLLPPFIKLLASKKWLPFLTTNGWASKVISAIFIVIAFPFIMFGQISAENDKNIAIYNADPGKVKNQVKQALDKKDFISARLKVLTFKKAMPNNPELKALMAQIESEEAEAKKQDEERKIKAAKEQAKREAERARVSTSSNESQPGYKYLLVNSTTGRGEDTIYSSLGACSSAKAAKSTTDWQCIGRPKFNNEN